MNDAPTMIVEQIERLEGDVLEELVAAGRSALGGSALDEWLLPVIASCGWLYVGRIAGEVAGSAEVIRRREEDELYLEGLYVVPRFQGRGLARLLLDEVMALLAAAGYRRLWATLDPDNEAGAALYRSCGFSRAGELPDHYGPGRDRLLLHADIGGRR